ncbi:MAG: hypothetical protein H6702_16170 [Myxococcales bacterium]|nr:hypothetical protein [Myxococcales bacterium]
MRLRTTIATALLVTLAALAGCDDEPATTPADAAVGGSDAGGLIDSGAGGVGGGEGGMGGGVGGMGGAGGEGGMGGGEAPACDPMVGYGLQTAPRPALGEAGFSPRAVWTGSEWGVTWQAHAGSATEPDLRHVYFQRFDGNGQAQGAPLLLGQTKVAPHAVAWTGTRFATAIVSARIGGVGFGGIQIQLVEPDGTASGEPAQLNTTFDATHLALAYAPGATGVVVYSRGQRQAGADGLFARPLDEQGQPEGPAVTLTETGVLSPDVAFGDGAFGVVWMDRDSARPLDIAFTLISERATPIGEPRRIPEAGAQGQVHLAYGAGAYGIGWSTVDQLGELTMRVTLFDLNGDPLDEVDLTGPEGFGLVTDVAWLDPNFFAVAWQDNAGDKQTIGLSRVTPAGNASAPVRLAPEDGAPMGNATVAGTISRAGLFFVRDPSPPAAGYSEDVRVQFSTMAPCR